MSRHLWPQLMRTSAMRKTAKSRDCKTGFGSRQKFFVGAFCLGMAASAAFPGQAAAAWPGKALVTGVSCERGGTSGGYALALCTVSYRNTSGDSDTIFLSAGGDAFFYGGSTRTTTTLPAFNNQTYGKIMVFLYNGSPSVTAIICARATLNGANAVCSYW